MDGQSLGQLLDSLRVHDRAESLAELIQTGAVSPFLPAGSVVSCVDKCWVHDRAKAAIAWMSANPTAFATFSEDQWTDLIETCRVHDRYQVVEHLLRVVKGARVNMTHLQQVWIHDRAKLTGVLAIYMAKNRGVEAKAVADRKAEEEAALAEALRVSAAEAKLQAMAAEQLAKMAVKLHAKEDAKAEAPVVVADEQPLALLNPSGIKKACVATDNENDQCSACTDHQSNVVGRDCGHRVFCLCCVPQSKGSKCPICQKPMGALLVIS